MTKLTILSTMAAPDFERALDLHQEWDLEFLDLKNGIFGKSILDLTDEEAGRARDLVTLRDLLVYCFSTNLFDTYVEKGEEVFRTDHLNNVTRAIELAHILQPTFIRLIAARTERRDAICDGIDFIHEHHPWLIPMYREAVDLISDAGFRPTIENEVGGCLLSTPDEMLAFFQTVDRSSLSLTWDVQNLWQMGTAPSLSVYEQLQDLIGYYHLKGGRSEGDEGPLCWSTTLEDASWPVLDITRRVVDDDVSPVICLNPSHGRQKPGYNYVNTVERDIGYLRKQVREIA